MASKFGGVPVDEPNKSQFGGVPVENTETKSPLFNFERMKQNLPASIGGALEGLAMPLYRPNQFAKGLGKMAMAGIENFASNVPGFEEMPTPERDAIVDYYKGRYGGADDIQETLETDPAGAALDVISAAILGKGLTRGAKEGIASTYSDDLPVGIYESAAKFSTTIKPAERRKIVETLLKEKIPLSEGGVAKAADIINSLDETVDRLIKASDTGVKYPRPWTVRTLNNLADAQIGKLGGGDDARIIRKVIDDYLDDISSMDSPYMSLQELQQWKQDAYKRINWKNPTEDQNARNLAYKEAAGTARKDIENLTTGDISNLNRRQGDLINALDPLSKAANRIGNRNIIGMDDMLKPAQGGMGAYAFGIDPSVGIGLGATMSAMGRPAIKSRLAQALYNAQRPNYVISNDALIKSMMLPALQSTGTAGQQ